jgi:3-hydroxyacyl-CoA dehydrogenase
MEVKIVGVVGCGQMGGDIAQISAQSGYQVVVSEINNQKHRKGEDYSGRQRSSTSPHQRHH